jgi:hypothetical protein
MMLYIQKDEVITFGINIHVDPERTFFIDNYCSSRK